MHYELWPVTQAASCSTFCLLSVYVRGYGDGADVGVVIDIIVMHRQRSTGGKYIVAGFFRDRSVRKSKCLFGS